MLANAYNPNSRELRQKNGEFPDNLGCTRKMNKEMKAKSLTIMMSD